MSDSTRTLTTKSRVIAWLVILAGIVAIPVGFLIGVALDSERFFFVFLIFGIVAIVGGIYSLVKRTSVRELLATPVRGRRTRPSRDE